MLENGTIIIIDDEKKSQGVIVGSCVYSPSWANEENMQGYIVESENYDSVIVVHTSNVIGIVKE